MSWLQYGVYLIPPPPLIYALSVAHQVLASEFNARVAGKFMAHATIKGFFKPAPGATPADFLPALDALFARTPAFPTKMHLWVADASPASPAPRTALLLLEKSPAFQALHEAVWDIVKPYVAPDCLFTPVEPAGPHFTPHLTLAQLDLPGEPGLLAQATALCRHIVAGLPTQAFVAQDLQLIEFTSDDWAGAWGETLRFRQLKGWHLPEAPPG